MRRAGFILLDCQFMTDHLASLGAREIPQGEYIKRIKAARGEPPASIGMAWRSFVDPEAARNSAGAATVHCSDGSPSSPGKRIAQSLTQTS
jgi:leucyl/phenylalanyl-tRNA--protein transferase